MTKIGANMTTQVGGTAKVLNQVLVNIKIALDLKNFDKYHTINKHTNF